MLFVIVTLIGIGNVVRVLWITPARPSDDVVWDACLLKVARGRLHLSLRSS